MLTGGCASADLQFSYMFSYGQLMILTDGNIAD
jgi:hypothetical protein